MRIQMLGSEWFASRPGGLNRYFQGLFEGFASVDEVAVTAHAFGEPPPGGASWGPTGLPLHRRVRAARVLTDREPLPDVIDQHFALYGGSARRARRALKVVHFQGPWAQESVAAGSRSGVRVKRAIEQRVYDAADCVIVLSNHFRNLIESDYGVTPERVHIIPPGVDLHSFSSATAVESGRPVVLCVRRLERRMGIHVLLDAWSAVRAVVPDAELRIVGTGTYETELRTRARTIPGVSFVGRATDAQLRREYALATITAVPSIELEGFGLIALESLAAGAAPIVTDCGGLPDSVRGLDPTLIVPANDAEALAARLVGALEGDRPSPEACRAYASTFSWEAVARAHRDVFIAEGAAS